MTQLKAISSSILTFASLDECVECFAEDVADCLKVGIKARGRASLAVSGGRTPEHIFPLLSRINLPWDKISITLADERWVDADHPDSNEGLARRLLLQGLVLKAHFVGLKTEHNDPFDGSEECEAALATLDWPIDALYLGMGEDGHIASLFPGTDDWLNAPKRAFPVGASGSRQPRMSLTPSTLLNSRHIFLVITGPEKCAIYEKALQPGPVVELPVRLILHQNNVPVRVYIVD